ncbi:MAG: aminodeoxychorismate synthase component I [Bacteroidetes bacterium]|jgi:para-aminobenzoate synthetase component 1|nr:aminodeoxychorismate synthase component I [Bacteroidota bacterium]
MLETTTTAKAARKMNEWGAQGIPFLFLVDFEQEQPIVARLDELDPEELLFDINGKSNALGLDVQEKPVMFERYPMSRAAYAAAFEIVQAGIKAGDSYLLNLAFPTPVRTNLSLQEIFLRSRARYRVWLHDQFTCFSPETFVTVSERGRIASNPMKGTIDASLPNAQDQLLKDEKERAEHATIVDLIRNDLSQVAEGVRVDRYRYIEAIATHSGGLLQSSSEISGQLPPDFRQRLGDLLFRLLPAGSISGAPKQKTLEIIRDAERQKRRYYTGICGLFDGKQLDSGVMIRFIENQERQLLFKSGGGITARSRMEEEYQEMVQKAYLPFTTEAVPAL